MAEIAPGSSQTTSVPLPSGPDVLRVTTFNLLAPVWTHRTIYPGMDMAEFEPSKRRAQQLQALKLLDPDVVCMQECQKSELEELLALEEGFLQGKYDVEFCAFPSTFWTNWLTDATNYEPRENGVCVLTKKSAMRKLGAEHVPIDLPHWKDVLPESSLGAHACFVKVTVNAWQRAKALVVTSHLDADSAFRAGLQGKALCRTLTAEYLKDYDCIIWGGDFNMEWRNSALSRIQSQGFTRASQEVRTPTVYSCGGCVRVDHIFFTRAPSGSVALECLGTYVPTCPMGHLFKVIPLLTEIQWLVCSAKGDYGRCQQVATVLLMLLLFPLVILLFVPVIILATCGRGAQLRRVTWALRTWGSDHLPVTVSLRGKSGGGAAV
uniref:Endonuclease/exonuclease/phosphatase domain-containing protein n=1 Tax=Alexandrium monilatum TaxID=311494 RepID=A0A7S4W1G3_9DINO